MKNHWLNKIEEKKLGGFELPEHFDWENMPPILYGKEVQLGVPVPLDEVAKERGIKWHL